MAKKRQDDDVEYCVVDEKGRLGVVVIQAIDWTMFGEQMALNDILSCDCLEVLVAGILVREDDEYVCIAQQVFDDESTSIRFTVMIPKVCILERHDFKIGDQE